MNHAQEEEKPLSSLGCRMIELWTEGETLEDPMERWVISSNEILPLKSTERTT